MELVSEHTTLLQIWTLIADTWHTQLTRTSNQLNAFDLSVCSRSRWVCKKKPSERSWIGPPLISEYRYCDCTDPSSLVRMNKTGAHPLIRHPRFGGKSGAQTSKSWSSEQLLKMHTCNMIWKNALSVDCNHWCLQQFEVCSEMVIEGSSHHYACSSLATEVF
jgi:hypothetical protein